MVDLLVARDKLVRKRQQIMPPPNWAGGQPLTIPNVKPTSPTMRTLTSLFQSYAGSSLPSELEEKAQSLINIVSSDESESETEIA